MNASELADMELEIGMLKARFGREVDSVEEFKELPEIAAYYIKRANGTRSDINFLIDIIRNDS